MLMNFTEILSGYEEDDRGSVRFAAILINLKKELFHELLLELSDFRVGIITFRSEIELDFRLGA